MNIAGWADDNIARYGDYPALAMGDRVWTSTWIHSRACRFAKALVDAGVAPGDRVLVLLPSCPEVFVAAEGVWRAGGILVLGYVGSPPAEILRIVEQARPAAIVVAAGLVRGLDAELRGVPLRITVGDAVDAWRSLDALVLAHEPLERPVERGASDVAQLAFSSGVTGTPKGVVFTHGSKDVYLREILAHANIAGEPLRVSLLATPPVAFGGFVFLSRQLRKETLVLVEGPDPRLMLEAIARHRVTHMDAVPSLCEAMLDEELTRGLDLRSLRGIVLSGARCSPELLDRAEARLGVRPTIAYGMTEAGGAISWAPAGSKPGSVGRVFPAVKVRIVDDEGNPAAAGARGELYVVTPWMASGYYEQPAETERVFRDGWIKSGDIGYFDADGELFLVGRSKEMFIQSGVNVFPQEVCDVIRRMPGVDDCAVVGVPNPYLGEEGIACVVPASGHTLNAEAILSSCRAEMDVRKVPLRVRFFDALPKTALGKVETHKLRGQLVAELSSVRETELVARLRAMSADHGRAALRREIAAAIRRILASEGAPPPGDLAQPLGSLGLTSLGAVRLANALGELLGAPLPPTLTFRHPTLAQLTEALFAEVVADAPAAHPASDVSTPRAGPRDEAIAIVGIACRLPGGVETPEGLWALLRNGVDATRDPPRDRGREWADPRIPRGGFLDAAGSFDADFFGLRPQAEAIDPQHRLLLEIAWEALERAGCDPRAVPFGPVGLFVGMSGSMYPSRDPLGTALSMGAARIAHFLDLTGPVLTMDTACSSSLVAVHEAVTSLRRGECSTALVAGVNVLASSAGFRDLADLGVLATDGRSRAFDAGASGFARAEGCVAVVLRRLSDAVANGDHVHAVVAGTAILHDGRSSSLTAPNPRAQERTIRAALRAAKTPADRVQYVEAHGTGTILGDPIEVEALQAVFGARTGAPLAIGSIKTNLGHLEAGAGLLGLVKVALAIEHRLLPASLHFERPNPHIPWDKIPIVVQQRLAPWPAEGTPLVAGVSSFGLSGTNAHAVVEEAPGPREPTVREGAHRAGVLPLLLSARTPEALRIHAGRFADFLEAPVAPPPSDIAFTAGCRRPHLECRVAVVGETREEWAKKLRAYATDAAGGSEGRAGESAPRLAMLFSGQGTQWFAMGRELLRTEPVFRDAVEECARHTDAMASWRLLDELGRDEATTRLADTEIAQPALFALEVGLYALWSSWGVTPAVVLGHSVGEIAAAHVAGALTLEAAASLAVARGRILQKATGRGKMASVNVAAAEAEKLVRDFPGVEVAASNAPRATTLSGEPEALSRALAMLRARGVECQELRVNYAFHSAQMDGLDRELVSALGDRWQAAVPRVRMISSVTAGPAPALDAAYWGAQVRKRVRFHEAMRALIDEGVELFLEVGPHPVLLPSVDQALEAAGARGVLIASLRRREGERSSLMHGLATLHGAGAPVDWRKVFDHGARVVPSVPTNTWQHEDYWSEGTAPVREEEGSSLLRRRFEAFDAPGKHIFEIDLDATKATMADFLDHRVNGEAWLPAAAFLELMWDAATRVHGDRVDSLESIQFEAALQVPPDRPCRVQVIVQPEGASAGVVRVLARDGDDHGGGEVVEHARASLRLAPPKTAPRLDGVGARCAAERSIEDFYGDLARRGIEYGPAFRALVSLKSGEREAVGDLRRAGGAPTSTAFAALLDASFQTASAAVPAQPDEAHVPTSLASFRIFRSSAPAARTYGRSRTVAGGAEIDAYVLDSEGRALVEALGMRGKAVAVRRRDVRDEWLYRVAWTEGRSLSARAAAGDWLILADRGGVGEALAARLQRGGARTVLARAGTDYAKLLADQPALTGVVDAFALDLIGASPAGAQTACAGVFQLVQALARQGAASPPRLFVLTRGAQPAGGPVSNPDQAALWGFGATLAHEMPELRPTLVDLDAQSDAGLFEEVVSAAREDRVALRGARRLLPRLVRHRANRAEPITLRADRSYLLTGGLGGLGLVVARRFVERGARNLVLLGRTGASSAAAHEGVAELQRLGAEVHVLRADVANEGELRDAMSACFARMPPLAGVVHAAGVLDDGILLRLDAERVTRAMAAKVRGAYHLHSATKDDALDFFLLFSSFAGVVGTPGQAPYAAANAFLDAFAHWRRQQGLPAQAIAWGGWAEVGLAARKDRSDNIRRQGGGLMPPADGADVMERIMGDPSPNVVAVDVDFRQWSELNPRAAAMPLLDEVMAKSGGRARAGATASALREKLRTAEPAARTALVEGFVRSLLGDILRMKPERLGFETPLKTLGLDSLMFVAVRNEIGRALGVTISAASVMASTNARELAERLGELVDRSFGKVAPAAPAAAAVPAPPAPAPSPPANPEELQSYLESLAREGYLGKQP